MKKENSINVLFWTFCFFILIGFLSIWQASNLFTTLSYSQVLVDEQGKLLAARVAADGQWRFPQSKKISDKYLACVLQFEDRRFYQHIGVDIFSLFRALQLNIKHGRIISGGSTLTMQIVRLALGNQRRTYLQKCKEIFLAMGLEFLYPKKKILAWYTTLAPYGGNVVGLETAIWRYFQSESTNLTWAQNALLAVLPNQPSAIHVSRNRLALIERRNLLLFSLWKDNQLDSMDYQISIEEPLPDIPFRLPKTCTHLLDHLKEKCPKQNFFQTTINYDLQNKISEISLYHANKLKENEINNLAVLLVDNKTRQVKAYIGNNTSTEVAISNQSVNNIHSSRSSGSILKPILYACMLDKGNMGPNSLLPDIPTLINGFRPENFSLQYEGAVKASEAIQRSLNVPSVKMLFEYGVDSFYLALKKLGLSTLFRPAEDYGLSLILGGAETTVWDIGNVYSGLAKCLDEVYPIKRNQSEYVVKDIFVSVEDTANRNSRPIILSAASLYHMVKTMQGTQFDVTKNETFYQDNEKRLSWKTGTSFGYKDAWCVGFTQQYTCVVWVGNSNGVGRPGLIGLHTAAPLLFEVFSLLKGATEWKIPYDDMRPQELCKQSGYTIGPNCTDTIIEWLPNPTYAARLKICPYHQKIFLDSTKTFQVFQNCARNIIEQNWFILPSAMEYYYRIKHLEYKLLPDYSEDCKPFDQGSSKSLEFLYPNQASEIFIPIDLDLHLNEIYFKAAHKVDGKAVHWFMDGAYLETTVQNPHSIKIQPKEGKHVFLITDDQSNAVFCTVQFYRRE